MITLVAAIDLNNGIGYKNELLTLLPNDMKYFKHLTTSGEHNVVVMGRKTYESIGKPLSGRINAILTKDMHYKATGCIIYHFVEDVIREYKSCGDSSLKLWIIGGSEIYNQFLPHADVVQLTIINHLFTKADAFFPKLSDDWKVVEHIKNESDAKHPYGYSFVTFQNKNKLI